MKQFGQVFYFEWKKIWQRKSTWITLGILVLFYLVMDGAFYFGSTYVDGEFLETHIEGTKKDVENGRRISGRKIDDSLLQEMWKSYDSVKGTDSRKNDKNDKEEENKKNFRLTEEYQTKVRPYIMLEDIVQNFVWRSTFSQKEEITENELYEARKQIVSKVWDEYKLSDSEKEYWKEKEEQLSVPFTYQYAEGYDYMIDMGGVYRVCLLLTFLIAVCMSGVFTEEHSRRTDQLILCSKLGRTHLYFAKVAAGSIFTVLVSGIVLMLSISGAFLMYGQDGFSAAVQLMVPFYSYSMTNGQTVLIMVGILLLSSVLSSVFVMVFSEITCSSTASMAALIALTFLGRLFPVSVSYRLLSQIWNWMPINLLKYDAGFFDPRLVSIFGMKFTSWQAAPVCYIVLTVLLVFIGRKVYCGYQLNGR